MELLTEELHRDVYETGPKLQRQERKYQEANASAGKNGQQKMAEPHFGNSRRQGDELERRRRRKHRGKH